MKLGMSSVVFAAALALVACAPARFTYAPVATTSADLAGMTAATYPVPARAPTGEVHVAVLGISDIRRHPRAPFTERAIRVSLVISNRSLDTWRVEGGAQHVELTSRRTRITLDAMNGANGAPVLVDIPSYATRWVDLVFPIPEGTDDALLGSFDVTWSVRLGPNDWATRQTRFEKLLTPPAHGGVERAPDPYAPAEPPASMPLPGNTSPHRRTPTLPTTP